MSNSLKTIAVDLTPILPGGENGGAKIFVLELLTQLAQLAPNTEFILLTQAASHEELKAMECANLRCLMILGNPLKEVPLLAKFQAKIQGLPYVGRRFLALLFRIHQRLKRRKANSLLSKIKADLLFCPFTAPTYSEPEIPTVCTIYDLQYKTYPQFFNEGELFQRNQTFITACHSASMLTAISEYSRLSAIKHGAIKPEKIRTIHLQMAHHNLPKADDDKSVLNRLRLTTEQYLLYPANFWKHKNHEMLLTAFGLACREKLPANIKLVCTGAEGSRQLWLTQAAAMMGLSERIIFPGFLSNQELAQLMSHCLAVIFPSLYEGFGLPLIEAMAVGVPVACSNLSALPEIAADAALRFNPRIPEEIAAALINLAEDKALRTKLIDSGKKRAQLFSDSGKMAQEYWELFQQAVSLHKQEEELSLILKQRGIQPNYNEAIELTSIKKSA
ncbi:MAG: glycosyltransferase family 4 protein [Tatlockia sp.]|nr:glycosyltransferase family 4 protein [Tatlockia sp.]